MSKHEDLDWTPREVLADLADADTPWDFYLSTKVTFFAESSIGSVTPDPDGEGDTPLFGPLHVVTAIQPKDEPAAVRHARMRILDMELKDRGVSAMRAVGSAFDGTHSEESRALFGLSDAEARELGLRFGQVAVFAWRGRDWSLLACATEKRADRPWTWVN